MRIVEGGITAAEGFSASGIHCGIKYKHKDLALIYSRVACVASGLFTQNRVQAAPLKITQRHLKDGRAQAVIINSGNANSCTGRAGLADAEKTCASVASKLGLKSKEVLVASTGTIGQRLPIAKIINKLDVLMRRLSPRNNLSAARAIMTTDTKPKQIAVQVKIGAVKVKIGGMAKGAGMIAPHLATMLAFIATDAAIDKAKFKKALCNAVENSFNLITVEGDTSTNDMVLGLANGLAGNKAMDTKEFRAFQRALNFVCLSLAKMIISDAEGSTKFVEIKVEKAESLLQAKKVAFKIANSPLVKSALFGQYPNWGRIAACVGAADRGVRPQRLDIYLGAHKVLAKGAAKKVQAAQLNRIFKKDRIQIRVVLGLAKSAVRIFTCDLSRKYIKINAEY